MRKITRKLMGLWDCGTPGCNKKRILGTTKKCPRCGDPRNPTLTPSEEPYLPDDAQDITGQDIGGVGPDWNCSKCGTANNGYADKCEDCGKQRDSSDFTNKIVIYKEGEAAKGVQFDDPQQMEDDRVDDIVGNPLQEAEDLVTGRDKLPRLTRVYNLPGNAIRKSSEVIDQSREYHTQRQERLKPWEHWSLNIFEIIVGCIVTFIVITGGVLFYNNFIRTEPKPLTVTGLSWERRIEVEELKTFSESDWSIPAGGRETRHYQAIHHYNKVVDHYETVEHDNFVTVSDGFRNESVYCGKTTVSNGDGTFDEETIYCDRPVEQFRTENHPYTTREPVYRRDPVYRTKFDYDIDRWVTDRWITTSGEAAGPHATPYYPEKKNLQARERVGNEREETYTVDLEGEGHQYTRSVNQDVWNNLEPGEGLIGHITKRGALRQIDWPKV